MVCPFSFSDHLGFEHVAGSPRSGMLGPLTTVSEELPLTNVHSIHRARTDHLQPTASSIFPDDPLAYAPRVDLPRAFSEATRNRFSQLEEDAARYGDTVGRGRAREGTTISTMFLLCMRIQTRQQTCLSDC